MSIQQAYNQWSEQYDNNNNKTRDLEALALREILSKIHFSNCLEIGCGTGKNTAWLLTKADEITAVDLSENMLAKAKGKINSHKVQFVQADILQPWTFAQKPYHLISFSLMLEHIEHLDAIFKKASAACISGGYIYVCELHPFKQYAGTKARFETAAGMQIVECYDHHVSDFIKAATANGFAIEQLNEYFDDNDRTTMPRILTLLLKKRS
jgi:ubiquinone/menaquinone biosynthesis C-methylase UbiE